MKLTFKDFELLVPDLEKVLGFYKDTLGLPMRFRNETFADFDLGYGSRLALWEIKHASQTCGDDSVNIAGNRMMASMCLPSKDALQKAYGDLKLKKVELLQPPQLMPWGRYAFYFKDPNDYIWEVYTL